MIPNRRNTAFFSVCNNESIPDCVAALLSVRRKLFGAKLFVFSRNISDENKRKMKKFNIGFFDLDLRGKFFRHWSEPVEEYYIFAAPELLFGEGFIYSVYVDKNMFCIRNPLRNIGEIIGVAGEMYDLEICDRKIKHVLQIEEKPRREMVGGGVIYFNNLLMTDISLMNNAIEIFRVCLIKEAPVKSKELLFGLVQLLKMSETDVVFLNNLVSKCASDLLGGVRGNRFLFFNGNIASGKDCMGSNGFDRYKIARKKIYEKKLGMVCGGDTEGAGQSVNVGWVLRLEKRGLRYTNERKALNGRKKPIRIFVSKNEDLALTNFGDVFPLVLIPELFGYRVEACDSPGDAELLSVGSILFTLPKTKDGVKVWGSGFISEDPLKNEKYNLKKAVYYGVRGITTLRRIEQAINVKLNNISLGDPGILASVVFPASDRKNDLVGVVVHFIDVDNPAVEKIRLDKRFLVIDPLEPPDVVAREISSCRMILSSSLHGLIFADSYGIPNAHVQFSEGVVGGEYKFCDYDSGVGKKHIDAPIEKVFDDTYIEKIIREYRPIEDLEEVQRKIVESFPYD